MVFLSTGNGFGAPPALTGCLLDDAGPTRDQLGNRFRDLDGFGGLNPYQPERK